MYSLWHSIYPGDYGTLPHFAYEECLYRDNNRLVYMWDNAPQCVMDAGVCEDITSDELNALEASKAQQGIIWDNVAAGIAESICSQSVPLEYGLWSPET